MSIFLLSFFLKYRIKVIDIAAIWWIIIRFSKERNTTASPHIKKKPIVVKVLSMLDKTISVLFFVTAKYIYKIFIAIPGRSTNLNQIKSLVWKFEPKTSDNNLGKKKPNKAPAATERPSRKAKM